MGDWADDAALKIVDKYVNTDPNTPRLVTLIDAIAAALRDAAAEGRDAQEQNRGNEWGRNLIQNIVNEWHDERTSRFATFVVVAVPD